VAGPQGPAGNEWGEEAAVFEGFTTTSHDGSQGGREGMHALCDAEFAGAHLCHSAEYHLSNSATAVPAGGAWIDYSCGLSSSNITGNAYIGTIQMGRYAGYSTSGNCSNWTSDSASHRGYTLQLNQTTASAMYCDTPRPLACCSSPYIEIFAGYTSALVDGDMSGRAGAHAVCGAEFAGSHMCHTTEYFRSHPVATAPVTGAWMDYSAGLKQGSSGVFGNSYCGSPEMGRYSGYSTSGNCANWSSSSASHRGYVMVPTGATASAMYCDVARPVACCL